MGLLSPCIQLVKSQSNLINYTGVQEALTRFLIKCLHVLNSGCHKSGISVNAVCMRPLKGVVRVVFVS